MKNFNVKKFIKCNCSGCCNSYAQSSLEYLLVYAFGIISVVTAIIITWQSGVFSQTIHSSGIQGFSQVVIEDFIAKENYFNLSVKNNAPDTIRINKINISVEYKVECISSTLVDINPGEKTSIFISCTDFQGKYPSGKYYKANIDVEYINIRTDNLHHSLGTIWGIVE